jgi:hypothetical protein
VKHLKALLARIKAALTRGGSGAARREADQQVVRIAQQGLHMATETLAANLADFGRHHEDWHGAPPEPNTPREDPHHVAKARMGRIAERFLLAVKIVFWVVFGPVYFNVLAWLAVIIALCISITLSLGIKPLLAGLILKPGLTPRQKEGRLHAHVVAGIVAFAIAFGSLFLLRGLAGPLALIGALLVLPVLSATDLVLLYLIGIAHAFTHLYGWAAPFVRNHHAATAYRAEFEQHCYAAQNRLDNTDENLAPRVALPGPTDQGSAGAAAVPLAERRTDAATAAVLVLAASLLGTSVARAQAPPPTAPLRISTLVADCTASLFPSVATTMGPIVARSFTTWTEQMGSRLVRVSSFERDGWLPRTILQTTRIETACAPTQGERAVFRGIGDALAQQARDACDHTRAKEADRITTEVTKALTLAWHAPPIVDPKEGRSCTAFKDMLASAARIPAGNLVVIAGDTEETCRNGADPVPDRAAGAEVIIILVPSKTDMGPGVSAASRFTAKKAYLEQVAPWLRAILAPADVETYRLPIAPPVAPVTKISFWQR